MGLQPSDDLPEFPKLRAVDPQWVEHEGQSYLFLRDPLGLADSYVLVPQTLAPLLALCDGSRDLAALGPAYALRVGFKLPDHRIRDIVAQLDEALLLENGAYVSAVDRALVEYRSLPSRPPSHAGAVYPGDVDELTSTLAEYCAKAPVENGAEPLRGSLVGMVCPHIDYARGHLTYAELWQRAEPYLDEVELAIILGTDHSGGPGMLTPTRQSYATPHGVLPTDIEIVDGLAGLLGGDRAFAEELHHTKEHSIELAAVWFHHFLKGRQCPIVPVLCGSFHHYIVGQGSPSDDERIGGALDYLKGAMSGKKVLVIAAADLAHVGPAFGDELPLDPIARAKLAADDGDSVKDILRCDAESFLERSREEGDARRICGLSPIYLMLKLLEDAGGESLGYDQCPADAENGSVVSIVGALLYDRK